MGSPLEKIRHLHPCREAVDWLATQPSAAEAWRSCERGDWMLWLLGRISGPVGSKSRKKLVLAACACARLSLKYVPKGEGRPRVAIVTAERYARGTHDVMLDDVRNAAAAAAAAYAAYAYAYADAYAYAAAAYAAYAAYADAYAYAYAAYAYADAYAAYADAAHADTLCRCAGIVRKHYPRPPRIPRKK